MGRRWHEIEAADLLAVIMVRSGAAIPRAALAQATDLIDWGEIELVVFAAPGCDEADGLFCLPEDEQLHSLHLKRSGDGFSLQGDPLQKRVNWKVTLAK